MGALQKVAIGLAAVLGLGIIARRFEGGLGLGELGSGISSLGVGILDVGIAPFKAVGQGLGEVGRGITEFTDPFRDLINLFTGGQMFPDLDKSQVRPEDRNGGLPPINVSGGVLYEGRYWNPTSPQYLAMRAEDRLRL